MTKKEEVKLWISCGGLRKDDEGDVKFLTDQEIEDLPEYVAKARNRYRKGLLTEEDFLAEWAYFGKIEKYIFEHLEEFD
jgi:hypothetical protein